MCQELHWSCNYNDGQQLDAGPAPLYCLQLTGNFPSSSTEKLSKPPTNYSVQTSLPSVFKFHHHQAQIHTFNQLFIFNSSPVDIPNFPAPCWYTCYSIKNEMSLPWRNHMSKCPNCTHSLKAHFNNQLLLKALPPSLELQPYCIPLVRHL